ncbi:MAG: helix-turn-helix transcriptional regulator [Acidaminococcaceae bacterium]|nr:helix-turn-helix transcriptional regulator [Acidaminococcaceae bacterium]
MEVNGRKFVEAMAAKCITGQQLQAKSGVAACTITRAKQGAKLAPATIGKLARALGVDVGAIAN